jgi:hypothetical protein
VLQDLDRERETIFSFIVKASSNRSWTPPRGPSPALDLVADLTLQEVRVVLEDINDQPPRFTKAEYTAGENQGLGAWGPGPLLACHLYCLPIPVGVATDAKMGSELIQVLALDADIGNNSLVFYSILAIHYFRALANDSEDVGQVFTMGRSLLVTAWTVVWGRWGPCGLQPCQPFYSPTSLSVYFLICPPIHLYIYLPAVSSFFIPPSHLPIHPLFIHLPSHPPFHNTPHLSTNAPHTPVWALY